MMTVLASSSPSRRALLRNAGIEPVVIASDVDESSVVAHEQPGSVKAEVAVLARAKGQSVVRRLLSGDVELSGSSCVLIACDSLLELDGRSVGKPGNAHNTTLVWQRMRGRSAVLHSGHFVARLDRVATGAFTLRDHVEAVGSTVVHTSDISDAEIADYCSTGEPFNVAGALTIDGYGSAFVDRLEGDHTNVIGLSVPLVRTLVARLGVRWSDLWTRQSSLN